MRKTFFISLLCIGMGGHFLASADTANAGRFKAPNNAQKMAPKVAQKPVTRKPITQKPNQRPVAKVDPRATKFHKPNTKKAHHKHESSSDSSSSASSSSSTVSSSSSDCKRDCCQYVISSERINAGIGVVIDKSGVWCLDGNAIFNPRPSRFSPPDPRAVQAAITVAPGVSNVIIDLCDFRLAQAGSGTSSQTPFVVGILVPDPDPSNTDINFVGAESIYIQGDNAIIDGFSMYGVRIFAHTYDIRLTNLTIKNCGTLASLGLRPTVNGFEYLPHTNPSTPGFGPSFGVGGLVIGESTVLGMGPQFFVDTPNTVMNNVNRTSEVVLENISCLNNFFMGGMSPNVSDMTISDCHFDDTWSNDPGRTAAPAYTGIPAYGLNLADGTDSPDLNGNVDPCCLNVAVNNSTFNRTTLRGDFTSISIGAFFPAAGVFDTRSRNTTWNDCEMNNTTSTFITDASIGAAIAGYIAGGIEDATFNNCHFDGITSIGGINGVHISGSTSNLPTIKSSRNTWFRNCTSNNHRSIGDQQLPVPVRTNFSLRGYVMFYAKDVTFDNCISQDLVLSGPSGNARASVVGFFLGAQAGQLPPDPDATVQNIVYRNCIASRCQTLNGGSATGWFIATLASADDDALKPVVLENCISSMNETFTPTLTTPGIVQGSAFGYAVYDESQITPEEFVSFPVVFDGCKALHNKGLPSSNTTTGAVNPVYSSGFYLWNTPRSSLNNCDAIDNVYGVFLNHCNRCTVRNCRADNNVDLQFVPGTGEGFTDVGTGTPAVPTNSTSLFEANHAFANGAANVNNGPNGNYNVKYNGAYANFPIITGSVTGGTFQTLPYTPVYNVSITQ